MQKVSFYVFLAILSSCLAGYVFLQMRHGASPDSNPKLTQSRGVDTTAHSKWTKTSLSIDEQEEKQLHFSRPATWRADVKQPVIFDKAVSQGVVLQISAPDNNTVFEIFTPTKFRYYQGVLGQYLNPQQKPLTPAEIMTEFFNFEASQFSVMETPEIEIQASKKGMEQYYYSEKQQWFVTTTESHKKYYWISTEKSPTPGVYGDLGTWSFFGGILHLPHASSFSDYLPKFNKVYRSIEIERSNKEDKS
jgi:hypothetical protein